MIDKTLSLYIMQMIDQIFINMAIIIVRNENNFRVKKRNKPYYYENIYEL